MPEINFPEIDDPQDFSTPLPAGSYPCRVESIEEAETQNGDPMWKLRFVITSGEYQGRYIFDNMPFSESALKRVKLICSRLGLDVSRKVNVTPSMLEGKACNVSVVIEEYIDKGKQRRRNVVPFAGYERISSTSEEALGLSDEELPF